MTHPAYLPNLDPLVVVVIRSRDYLQHEAGGDAAMLRRLTCSADMEPVWEDAKAWAKLDHYIPLELLNTALALRRMWSRLSKVPTKEAVAAIREIESTVFKLRGQLIAHRPELHLLIGYDTGLRDLIVGHLRSKGRSSTARRVLNLDWSIGRRGGRGAIPETEEVLELLESKLAAARRKKPPIGGRPTKPGAKDAERTYCVQQLAAFFTERGMDTPHTAIAAIVNEVLDLAATSPLDASHVRKLLK